jgi:serine/threonine protein kinase
MDDIYKNKYIKYKNKYILLKQQGGFKEGYKMSFIGNGAFGCLICPPIEITGKIINNEQSFEIPDFSFDTVTNCDYVGKILAIASQNAYVDSYEDELEHLIKIKDLDPNGDYTPKLIYANIHEGSYILDSIQLLETIGSKDTQVLDCVKDKINPDFNYGYIIFEHVGITIFKKYYNKSLDIPDLISFLNKFNKLLEFIKKLYDNKYLHLDIKSDNITVKKNEDLCLIDFGRTIQLNKLEDYNYIILAYLSQNSHMYSFEPKIYKQILNMFKNQKKSFTFLKEYIKKNFKTLIQPYDITSTNTTLQQILIMIFITDFSTQTSIPDIHDYIYYRQEQYFSDYLDEREIEFLKTNDLGIEIDINKLLYHIFYPIIRKSDIYCMGLVLAEVVIILNNNYNNYNDSFVNSFENLIKSLLFNKFDDVDQIKHEINELIKLI